MPSDPVSKWVQWSLWFGDRDRPTFAASFITPSEPTAREVSLAFPLLRGWLFDKWSPEKTLEEAARHRGFCDVRMPHRSWPDRREYWLSEDKRFGFVIRPDSWTVVLENESLELNLELLKKLCEWLAVVWGAVAFGNDVRPPDILEEGVSAAKAYVKAPPDDPEMKEWWGRHAVKAADPGLPDLFFERQADDLVFSWENHVYILQAVIAVPTLRP